MKPNNQGRSDITHITLSVLFIGILILGSVWIILPFLMALLWATLIVVATWPLLLKLDAWLGGRRGLAVTVMTLAELLLLLVPLTLAVVMIVSHAEDIPARIKAIDFSAFAAPPKWLSSIPVAGKKLAERWTAFAGLSEEARWEVITPYARTALQWFLGKAGSIGLIVVQALLTLILSAVLYANGDAARAGILSFARRLAGRHGEEAALLAAKAARGVVLGVVGTALVQSGLGFLALLIAGVPALAILFAVMLLLCLAQLGPLLVLLPVAFWLYASGQAIVGTVVLIISIVAGTIDNVVRPLLIRKGVELPILLIIGGVIGGLIAFGVIGLFIGPVLLAVTQTLLKAWVSGNDGREEEAVG
jgi:predicted PurR-regulated permease PerM